MKKRIVKDTAEDVGREVFTYEITREEGEETIDIECDNIGVLTISRKMLPAFIQALNEVAQD